MTIKQKENTAQKAVTTVDVVKAYHSEKTEGRLRRRAILIVRIPLCQKTMLGFSDTVENYVSDLSCVAAALQLSSTEVAVIAVDTFDAEQVEAVVCTLARYRELSNDQYIVRKLPSTTATAKELRRSFDKKLQRAMSRAGAGAIPLQFATSSG